MRLRIESRSVNEAFGRSVVAAFAAQLDPNIEDISDIKTAVSEAITNCIVHAYANTVGSIYIWSGIYENGIIRTKKVSKFRAARFFAILIPVLVLVVFLSCLRVVPTGHTGIVTTFGSTPLYFLNTLVK